MERQSAKIEAREEDTKLLALDLDSDKVIYPMLCKGGEASDDPDYIWEQKFDGARILAQVGSKGSSTRLWSRSGLIKTETLPELDIKSALPAVLDGEVVSGKDFSNIQHRINRQQDIGKSIEEYPCVYMVFDILQVEGKSLSEIQLIKRRSILQDVLQETENVLIAPYYKSGLDLLEEARLKRWEGIVGKFSYGGYRPNKRDWIKVKLWKTDNFRVTGYTKGTGRRESTFGALVLSTFQGALVGEVGTGFTDQDLEELSKRFNIVGEKSFITSIEPFTVKVQYLEITEDGQLRFPSFKGVID